MSRLKELVRDMLSQEIEDYKEDLADAGFDEESIQKVEVEFENAPCEIKFKVKGAVTDEQTYNKLMGNGLAPVSYEGEMMWVKGRIDKCYCCPYPKLLKHISSEFMK